MKPSRENSGGSQAKPVLSERLSGRESPQKWCLSLSFSLRVHTCAQVYTACIDVTSAAIAPYHAPVSVPSAAYTRHHQICRLGKACREKQIE